MKIFLVSYFFPPKNNVAASRWGVFVDKLKSFHHEVLIFTNNWGNASENVITINDGFSEDANQNKTSNLKSLKGLILKFVPLFILIDGKFFWSIKVYKKLKKIIKTKKPDIIIVSGTPWSSVLVISLFCKFYKIKLVTDFRDFWTYKPGIHFNNSLAEIYFKFLEKIVVKNSKLMITVTEPIKDYLLKIKNIPTLVIPNGYLGDLLSNDELFNQTSEFKHKWLYAGSISQYHAFDVFLEQFTDHKFLTVLGEDHVGIVSQNSINLIDQTSVEQAELIMKTSCVLVMTLRHDAKHFITGKIMSYIKAERPILYYGPEQSPAAELIRNANIGWVIQIGDVEKLKNTVTLINKHIIQNKPFEFKPNIEILRKYSVNGLVKILHEGLETLR